MDTIDLRSGDKTFPKALLKRTSAWGVRCDKARFSGVQVPPGNRPSRKQPEQLWR